jgi:hypothetical protein
MQSPIRHLMADNLATSVFTIAPERPAEFDTTLNNFDLIYVNQRRWKFCAYPERTPGEVWVSRGAVELIWCASLAHFLFYTRFIQRKRFDTPTEIDPHSAPAVSNALHLLRWAIKCQSNRHAYRLEESDLNDVRSFDRRLTAKSKAQRTPLQSSAGFPRRCWKATAMASPPARKAGR